MNKNAKALVVTALCLSLIPVSAQMGAQPGGMGGPPGPDFSGSMRKLFGKNSDFSASLEMQAQPPSGGETMTIPGKVAVAGDKSRFELNLADIKGGQMPPQALAQMKSMGMDQMVSITLPEKKTVCLVYPGLQAYAEMPIQDPDAAKPQSDFKIETTDLGKETVDGHACVKSKVVVTDDKGIKHEFTLWKAGDLKDFPIKVQTTEKGHTLTMLFKDVKLSKPDASLFEPPANYKKYGSMMEMMQQEMMKRMGGGMGAPPQQ